LAWIGLTLRVIFSYEDLPCVLCEVSDSDRTFPTHPSAERVTGDTAPPPSG
jgi:hypothetical protein